MQKRKHIRKYCKRIKLNFMKKFLRKRNKLVQLATTLKGEQLSAVESAIRLMDIIIQCSAKDEEMPGNKAYISLNFEIIYLDTLLTN